MTIKDELTGKPMSHQLRYYHRHKTDEAFKIRTKEAAKRYYIKNKEIILARLKARYVANKAKKEGQVDGHTTV